MSGNPRAAVVIVGSEILLDGRLDTNGPFMEESLCREGITCVLRLTVRDERAEIADALRMAARRADIVIVSGGLGPTFDDLTREAAADAFGLDLSRDPSIEAQLRERFLRRGLAPAENVFRMADLLQGAEALTNNVGSAPGQCLPGPPMVALLPGVPSELHSMMSLELLPRLRARFATAPPLRRVFKIAGLFESEVENRLASCAATWKGIDRTILAAPGEVTYLLRAASGSDEAIEDAAAAVRAALGDALYAEAEEGIESCVGRMLGEAGLTLATAESCTAGMLASMITSVPGSSAYFVGGVVAYADRIKEAALDVPPESLARHGAVSEETAMAMARGVRARFGSTAALAVTGVAGPGGGTESKPVGLVHLASAASWGESARVLSLSGDRKAIRLRACRAALDLLRLSLLRAPSGPMR